ncbi:MULTISPECIES: hypothetical protein [Rhizobium/Agrobacterium group]|nr:MULTISPECIES: hypothetical protein [Rhizobium/Agrobacterium group]
MGIGDLDDLHYPSFWKRAAENIPRSLAVLEKDDAQASSMP